MFARQVSQFADLRQRHEALGADLDALLKFATGYKDAHGSRLRVVGPVDGADFTLQEAVQHAQRAVRSFRALRLDKNCPVPSTPWAGAIQSTSALEQAVGEFMQQAASIRNDSRALKAVSGSRLVLEPNGEPAWDLSALTRRVTAIADDILNACASLSSVCALSVAAKNDQEIVGVRDDAAATLEALQVAEGAAKSAQEAASQVASLLATASGERGEMGQVLTSARSEIADALEKLRVATSNVAERSTEITSNAAVASAKFDEMKQYEAQAKEVHQALSVFSATLDGVNKRIEEAAASSEKVKSKYEEQSEQIREMIAQAEKMVGGATVAGLAQAFRDERASLERSMRWTFSTFLVGIGLLVAASVVLAIYLLEIPLPGLTGKAGSAAMSVTLQGVVSRSVIILGPFWLTLFAARRYRDLFNLRQKYSHKYNMAFSMNGFKNEAPSYKEQIAAWVFQIVAEDPIGQGGVSEKEETPPTTLAEIAQGVAGHMTKLLPVKVEG